MKSFSQFRLCEQEIALLELSYYILEVTLEIGGEKKPLKLKGDFYWLSVSLLLFAGGDNDWLLLISQFQKPRGSLVLPLEQALRVLGHGPPAASAHHFSSLPV